MVNTRDQHGRTALIRSVKITDEASQQKVVRMLLKYGANVNLKDNMGRTALSYACEYKCNDVIRELVKNNVDPNIDDNNGNTPLVYCAQAGNHEAVTILAKCFRRLGLEVDKYNADGMTALMIAARNGYLECARCLVHEAKASAYRRDTVKNMTSLDWARDAGCEKPEMELLLPKRLTRDRPKQTHHISLDKYQDTFDAGTGKEFSKALSCDSYLPDLVSTTSPGSTPPENSPSFFHRRKLKQNFEKLSQKLHSRTLMRASNSLSKLDQQRVSSTSNLMKESSLSEELDTDFEKSHSFDNGLVDHRVGKFTSNSSLSPHPPGGLKRSYLSRSHETISQTMFSRDEQSSVKSTTNVKVDIMGAPGKNNNGPHAFLERQRALGSNDGFTRLPPLSPVPRKHITPEGR